jgi:hypothetical protein
MADVIFLLEYHRLVLLYITFVDCELPLRMSTVIRYGEQY